MAGLVVALERALAASGHSELRESGGADLVRALAQAFGREPFDSLLTEERITPRVYRLRFATGSGGRSFIVKRMSPEQARRNELAIRHWLPEVGLPGLTPRLLGHAATTDGRRVWHVYEDLGPWELASRDPDAERVSAVVARIAGIHARFAAHPILAECRSYGEAHGLDSAAANLRDAVHALERLRPPHLAPTAAQAELRDRLLDRLRRHLEDAPRRARALAELGGAETLLHGDLWTSNIFAEPAPGGPRVRFIDWDRAGVGSASYDLSTFLLRFDPAHRPGILSTYRQHLGDGLWRIPGRDELNLLFETAECGRYANRVIWPAIALLRDGAAWGFDELAAIETWFEALRPVLPEASA